MKRILINATHNEEIRVALCKDNHLYDFDLENRTREQKKANIYKGHITRVEPSLEAVFVEYGSARQGFLPLREIAPEYLHGNARTDNIRDIIKEGDEVIIQIEKEERGNKGAAVSTYISLAGRYLVLMPNNAKGGGISRQISGKVRDEIRSVLANLNIPKGMSVIVRTAGIGKSFEELELDLANLLDTWSDILNKTRTEPSPILLYQEAGVVTRAMRDYLRDDIGEIWIDSEHAYNEAANFISSVMPVQMGKLRKYTDYEPLFVRFGIERQIESAYQREVRLPSGGSIVIDQTEAMVAIDINSAKSTKGSDVAETAFHTNLEAADEIARQLRLRDMGGLIVIDFIDMADIAHQKAVEKRLIDATRYDRARVQFAEISKFGLMEMSRQRLRPSLEESTGYLCPRCHGNGMIRDLRSLALSIMRQIEQIALKERTGEIQAEVPTEISAFLLNEKRESLVYLEQDSGVRITILPHAHLESPNFSLHYNPDGFAPSSYERIVDVEERQNIDRGYEVNWQTPEPSTPKGANHWDKNERRASQANKPIQKEKVPTQEPKAVAWLSNLFAPKAQATLAPSLNTNDVATAIETLVNGGATSLGASGQITLPKPDKKETKPASRQKADKPTHERPQEKASKPKTHQKDKELPKEQKSTPTSDKPNNAPKYPKRDVGSHREPRAVIERGEMLVNTKAVTQPTPEKEKTELKVETPVPPKKADKKAERTEPAKPKKEDKPSKATDIAVRVERIEEVKSEPAIIHLSLDGSKAMPTPSESHEPTDTSTRTEVVIMLDTKSDALTVETNNNDEDNSNDTSTSTATSDTASIETTSDKADDAIVLSDVILPSVTEQEPKQEQAHNATPANDVSVPLAPAKPLAVVDLPKLARTYHTIATGTLPRTISSSPSIGKLTALAQQTNRAINDPRVVALACVATPTGTAGEFIHAHLANAQERLSQDGFVACFLEAIAQSQATHFDFANYGYQPLSKSDVLAFYAQVEPKSEFATLQGKTKTAMPPIGVRAINDPRGEYTPSVPKVVADDNLHDHANTEEPANVEKFAKTEETTQATEPNNIISAKQFDHLLSEMSTEEAFESVIETVENIINNTKDFLNEVENSSDGDKVEHDIKTSPESYKNMIENIAEQLLPQTGLLKLASPKKSSKKASTRKPSKVAIKIPKADTKPKTAVVIRRKPKPDAEVVNASEPTPPSTTDNGEQQ